MPTRVQLPDGNIGEFPDGMSNSQIEAVLQKQFPSKIAPAGPEARTFGNYASEITRGVGRGLKNDVQGVAQTVMHPIDTATGLVKQTYSAGVEAGKEFTDTAGAPMSQRLGAAALTGLENAPMIGGMVQRAEEGGERMGSPEAAGAAAEGITTLAAPELAGRAVGPLTRGLKDTSESLRRAASGTGTNVTKELVKKTQAENATEAEKATTKNADIAQKREATVQKVGEKLADVRAENLSKDAVASRKVALQRGIERLDVGLKKDLEATRDKVNGQANQKYADLRKVLKDEQAGPYQPMDEEGHVSGEPQTITEHLYEVASGPIRGSETNPTIIKSLADRLNAGETTLTYDDLQGYREEVGRELRKGSLAPDVFTAYKNLMPEIDRSMQEIADRKGLGKAQGEARDFYRRYAQTFLDSTSPVRKALESPERGGVTKAFRGKDQSGIQQLAQFDPELARRLNTVRGYADEAAKTRPLATRSEEPTLPPKTASVEPKTSKIGSEDIRAAKAEALTKRANTIEHRGAWVAAWPLFHIMSSVLHGEIANLGNAALESAATYGAARGIAGILRNPKVVEVLTKPTAEDLAHIPPDLRGDFPEILKAARAQGIRADPRFAALLGITGLNGAKARKLQEISDQYRQAAQ